MVISSIPPIETIAETTDSKRISPNLTVPSVEEPAVGEVIEQRTEDAKVFYEGKGKYRKDIFFEPIHKKQKGKKGYEEISADLVDDSANEKEVKTENTLIDTTFNKKMENGSYAKFDINGNKINYSLISASGIDIEPITVKDAKAQFKKKTNKIIHKDVFPDIDLQNITFGQNIKEDLVMNSYKGLHIFKFKLETDLSAEPQEDGSIIFKDEKSKQVFELPKPFMTDSNYDDQKGEPQKSENVKYELAKINDGYTLTVNADPKWLEDKNRKYPVHIDPTTSITTSTDTFVMSAYPTTNYSSSSSKWDAGQGQYVLKTGYYDGTTGTNYAFLNHSITSFQNMNVTSATFNVYVTHSYYATTANGLWLDAVNSSWSAGSMTWNNKPASTNITKDDVAREQWAQFNVTNKVKEWATGAKANYGFKLHTNGNGMDHWKKVVSSTNSTNKPYLSVTYTIPTASTPTGKVYSNGNGTGYADLSWPAVKGATGYKVWIFNGKDYEAFNVGNVTSWSTKGKKIWPTAAEISSGKFDLHQDSTGAELAIDPSPVYKNSGGSYPTNKNYWFRVSAIFAQGEGAQSGAYQPTLPNLTLPSTPAGTSYSNGNGTGYVDFKWNPVSGATGYKILLFNGKEYESLNVGNVTSWTTKGKKYWPTASEISAGRYKLHLSDGLGTELAVNPAPVYKNSAGNYQTATNYWFRVIAYNAQGETVNSNAYTPSITSMPKPAAPTGFTYTNMLTSNSGYVVLNWNEIAGAAGYKVWVFNGKEYQSFDAKNQNTWTTQGKGIWPTVSEISEGKYQLHTDGNGAELALDPSPVYKNSAGSYQTSKNYWFRVSAYDTKGETIQSNVFMPTFGQPVEFLGEEEYWSILDVPYSKVNMATGNLIVDEEDFSISGRGPELGLNRSYNSLSTSVGMFGPGWHSDAEMSVTSSPENNKATLVDEDGTVHIFTKLTDGTYKAPTGVYLELTEDSTHFILKTKDQTNAYFSKQNGRLVKIADGYGNTLTYTYDEADKLTTMTDASGRDLKFSYNTDGYVTNVTGPEDRKVSYSYQDGFLSKVTQTADEITSYEYNAGKLVKSYEPNHTETKPVVNQYIYETETDHLKEAIDPKGNRYLLEYDLTNKTLLFNQPNGRKIQYSYNEAANPTEMIEDVDGLKITTSYKYEGNNLIESKDPNDQNSTTPTESYKYDSNGNVISATDSYGTESYEYNSNNDVTSVTDTEGDQTTIAYEGLDAVSETDQTGKTSSVAKYQKDENGNSNGNLLESSYALGVANNVVQNNNFDSDLSGWNKLSANDSGSITVDNTTKTYFGLSGNKSLKLNVQSTSATRSYIAAVQEVPVKANSNYSLSGLIKTDTNKANAFFNVKFLDANNAHISWVDNRYSQISGTRTWTERQLSFKTPENAAKAIIYLEAEHTDADASGEAWFDMIQLEQAEVSSSYNPLNNSGFSNALTGWTGSGGTADSSGGFEDNTSLKLARTAETQAASEYKQTINIGQSASDEAFDMTLTGLSKAENVLKKGKVTDRDYSLVAKVFYTDGTTKEYVAGFPAGTQEWNRAAVKIPATNPVSKIEVSTIFKGSYTGSVWFDGIRLLKGYVISKYIYDSNGNYVIQTEDEFGYKVKSSFDTYGNKTSETDAKGIKKTYEYNLANQLQKILFESETSINYQYDKDDNIISKKIILSNGASQDYSYDYDELGNLTEAVGSLNHKIVNEYDENSNNVKTILPNGNTLTWIYDAKDRMKSVAYNGNPTYSYTYDKNGNETSVLYSKEGRSKNRTYDSSNRVVKQEDRGGTQEWKYSASSDKLKEFLLIHEDFVLKNTFQYNELNQNIIVSDGELNYRFDYDERGNIKTFTTGNGGGSSLKYDDKGLIQQLAVGMINGKDITDETYEYDANGNRTQIKYRDGKTISYEYSKLDQLEKESLKDGTVIEYTYDGFGNRTLIKQTQNGKTTSTASEYNAANQLTKFGTETITYDANGNRKEDGSLIYTWNSQDHLESVTKKGESSPFVTYKYDEDGRRIQKTVNSQTTNYFYSGDSLNVLYETDEKDQVLRSYIYSESGELLAMQKGAEKFFYHYNAHGDVIALSDKQGNALATYEYDAWGNQIKIEESDQVKDNPYRYAGYRYDIETDMYYLIDRYYNQTQGVFLSVDPDPGEIDDALTQNDYAYANNNPVMLVDPDGNAAVVAVYFVPGIGQVALMATGVVILGGVAYKAGTWIGKKAKDYYYKAQNNKQIKKRIEGLEKQVRKHKQKLANNPRSRDRNHWEKEIRAWEKEIARLKKRLKK